MSGFVIDDNPWVPVLVAAGWKASSDSKNDRLKEQGRNKEWALESNIEWTPPPPYRLEKRTLKEFAERRADNNYEWLLWDMDMQASGKIHRLEIRV